MRHSIEDSLRLTTKLSESQFNRVVLFAGMTNDPDHLPLFQMNIETGLDVILDDYREDPSFRLIAQVRNGKQSKILHHRVLNAFLFEFGETDSDRHETALRFVQRWRDQLEYNQTHINMQRDNPRDTHLDNTAICIMMAVSGFENDDYSLSNRALTCLHLFLPHVGILGCTMDIDDDDDEVSILMHSLLDLYTVN